MSVTDPNNQSQPAPKSFRGRPFVRTKELCQLRSWVCEQTLATWRHLCKGPRYFKVGRSVYSDLNEVDAWFESQMIDPTEI